jgi:predicted N-acetyltransferase YhbS
LTLTPLSPLSGSSAPTADTPAVRIVVEAAEHTAAFDALVDRVFGPGRFAKVSQRVREGNSRIADLCFMAVDDARVVGGVRLWPIHVGGRPAVFLGPVAVSPDVRSQGVGADLIACACEAAKAAGHGVILLVGDRSFFEPLGFVEVPRGQLTLPGAADPARILWRELVPGAGEALRGPVISG